MSILLTKEVLGITKVNFFLLIWSKNYLISKKRIAFFLRRKSRIVVHSCMSRSVLRLHIVMHAASTPSIEEDVAPVDLSKQNCHYRIVHAMRSQLHITMALHCTGTSAHERCYFFRPNSIMEQSYNLRPPSEAQNI